LEKRLAILCNMGYTKGVLKLTLGGSMRPSDLLRGEYIGVKELRQRIAHLLRSDRPRIVTERGKPRQVLIAYDKVVELIEILEELRDRKLMRDLERARAAYRKGGGVALSQLAKDLNLAA